jgi:hypothetical protein
VDSTNAVMAPRRLRVRLAVAGVIMLALWGWSLVPPIENWGNPNEDGFSYVPLFYTMITCLPLGIVLLIGAIAGHGRYIKRARFAFVIAAVIAVLVVTFLVVQNIADSNDGKVFGIQFGLRLDHHRDGGGIKMVGAAGFEPTTPCLPDKCANRAALRPDRNGADYRDVSTAVQPLAPTRS